MKIIESQLIYSWYKKALIMTLIWNINILVLFNKIQQSQLKLSTNADFKFAALMLHYNTNLLSWRRRNFTSIILGMILHTNQAPTFTSPPPFILKPLLNPFSETSDIWKQNLVYTTCMNFLVVVVILEESVSHISWDRAVNCSAKSEFFC